MAENRSFYMKFLEPKFYRQSDIVLGVGVVIIIVMLVIPLPAVILDFFIALSLLMSLVILLTVMYTRHAADFSVFPSLLLLSTIFRLAINVSSTRLILSEGSQFKGQIIRTFGDFVVAGNYVVGLIIFVILIAVQFIVITKGASRVAEVAARFTLDALPGKQMGIDTDLQNGRITEEEADRKRISLQKEVDFYGAMDGASKFVSGDVKVGILITLINMIGGLIIGMVILDESFTVAIDTYIKLTIGDGLSTQIPSLLITTATGIIVTRSISDEPLGSDLSNQLSSEPRALWIASGTLLFSTMIPGFPKIPLFVLSVGMGALAFQLQKAKLDSDKMEEERKIKLDEEKEKVPEDFTFLTKIEPLEVEIGFSLIPLVDPKQGGNLLESITSLRKRIALNIGLIVPPIRIRDNIDLTNNAYSIKIKGVEFGRAKLEVGKLLAINHGKVTEKMEGIETIDPAYNSEAIWIDPQKRADAEKRLYTVVDAKTVLLTHLEVIILKNAPLILGRQDVRKLMDNVKKDHQALVEELEGQSGLKLGEIQRVLQNLLREGVSIRNIVTIFETLASAIEYTKDTSLLTDYVRASLAAQITSDIIKHDQGKLYVITLDPAIERALLNSVTEDPIEGKVLALELETQNRLKELFIAEIQKAYDNNVPPVFLVSPQIRSLIFDFMEREIHDVTVISYNEISSGTKVEVIGRISPKVETSVGQVQEE